MSFKYSNTSRKRLEECHEDLQTLFNEVIKYYDCTIICGHRSEKDQMKAYRSGNSKLVYPQSKHNKMPSLAVDVAPYPIDWKDYNRFYNFGGYVLAIADMLGIKIRWGGDWDSDNNFDDQRFNDLVHFELKD